MTTILISAKAECENYSAVIKLTKSVITSYFRIKHATVDDEMPVVKVNDIEVNNANVNTISDAISVCCDLLVIVNSDSPQVKGKFIFLNKNNIIISVNKFDKNIWY